MSPHPTRALPPLRVALLGNPNCGKTALFNLLTGSRQKVANYAGVTVERKEGYLLTASGRRVTVLDLPGAYSLNALSEDEAVTRDVVTGRAEHEALPDLLVCVADATNLKLNLRLVLEAKALGLPMVLALNMSDMATREGISIDRAVLSKELGLPVLETVGVRHDGARELLNFLDQADPADAARKLEGAPAPAVWQASDVAAVIATQQAVRRILALAVREPADSLHADDAIDRIVLHPLWGMLLLAVTLFLMFQAVFSLAAVPMDWIKAGVDALGNLARSGLPEGPLQSLLVDGILAGAGGVLVFLPQILILFFFIIALEDSGYLPRAAFLLDRVMGTVGLSGRSFIPLLSSFACAIPGVMATRTISHWRDRLVTIMIAPLMTCSARLPVYALLIGAFIPARTVWGVFNLQGLVLFALYVAGILGAMGVAGAHAPAQRYGSLTLDDGAAVVPVAQSSQPRVGPGGARSHLPAPGGRHHSGADGGAVVSFDLSRPAAGRHRAGDSIQPGRADRAWPGTGVCADRFQLADCDCPCARHGCARSRRRGARHGVCLVGNRARCGLPAWRVDWPKLVARHGLVAAGLVCLCAPVRVDTGRCATGDQQLEVPGDPGRLPLCAGLCGELSDLSFDPALGRGLR